MRVLIAWFPFPVLHFAPAFWLENSTWRKLPIVAKIGSFFETKHLKSQILRVVLSLLADTSSWNYRKLYTILNTQSTNSELLLLVFLTLRSIKSTCELMRKCLLQVNLQGPFSHMDEGIKRHQACAYSWMSSGRRGEWQSTNKSRPGSWALWIECNAEKIHLGLQV